MSTTPRLSLSFIHFISQNFSSATLVILYSCNLFCFHHSLFYLNSSTSFFFSIFSCTRRRHSYNSFSSCSFFQIHSGDSGSTTCSGAPSRSWWWRSWCSPSWPTWIPCSPWWCSSIASVYKCFNFFLSHSPISAAELYLGLDSLIPLILCKSFKS